MNELVLDETQLPETMQAWLTTAPAAAFAVAMERLDDGRVLLRPLPDVDPALLARIRVTMAKYHEALMNLT